jgi:hypothetical protein
MAAKFISDVVRNAASSTLWTFRKRDSFYRQPIYGQNPAVCGAFWLFLMYDAV